jgi:hypothetical protein
MIFFEMREGLARGFSDAVFAVDSGKMVEVCVGESDEPSEAVVERKRL